MERLLTRLGCLVVLLGVLGPARADDRHVWDLDLELGLASGSSELGPWTEGGHGKLRYDAAHDELAASRVLLDYRGRIRQTLWADVALDFVDDASSGVDLSEAFLEWRPIPKSALQQRWRFGALYPPFSLENRERGWTSPFTISFSAINTWLGEELRPLAAEWSADKPLGFPGSPHRLRAFAAGFFANDPAGTLLYWRGFALHDRQTRLSDRLPMPRAPVWRSGAIVGYRDQTLEPFAEIDHRPGYYAGLEWRYAKRALAQLASWDNRADAAAFSGGQWGWRTRFTHAATQIELPRGLGLAAQWLRGATYWIKAATTQGTLTPASEFVKDAFESRFVLLTKRFGAAHRITARYDDFDMSRDSEGLDIDSGHALTLAYVLQARSQLTLAVEWLRIVSERDLWSNVYGIAPSSTERQLRLVLKLGLGSTRGR